jgi:hypothetical protein
MLFDFPPLSPRSREMRRVFGAIHAARGWGDGEFSSGPGSTRERAASFLPELAALVQSLGTRTLLDAACGDFNWMRPLADAVNRYIGIDVVPAIVRSNMQCWTSPRRRFLCRDLVRQRLPAADVVLSRDTLVHLTIQEYRSLPFLPRLAGIPGVMLAAALILLFGFLRY